MTLAALWRRSGFRVVRDSAPFGIPRRSGFSAVGDFAS
jgi:hypothetical protein